jgi:hypothetical protein
MTHTADGATDSAPVIKKNCREFKDRFDFEVLSGGMIITEKSEAY